LLLHLIMRQKPKRLPFPAFRFLVRKAVANGAACSFGICALLLMRMGLIALMCLALAKPRILSEALSLAGDRPAAVGHRHRYRASMGYTVAGRTAR